MRRLILAGSLLAAAPLGAQAPQLSTMVFSVPVDFQACRDRIWQVLSAEGYDHSKTWDFGNGWIALAGGTSLSIGCSGRDDRSTPVFIVTAGDNADGVRERCHQLMLNPPTTSASSPAGGSAASTSGGGSSPRRGRSGSG